MKKTGFILFFLIVMLLQAACLTVHVGNITPPLNSENVPSTTATPGLLLYTGATLPALQPDIDSTSLPPRVLSETPTPTLTQAPIRFPTPIPLQTLLTPAPTSTSSVPCELAGYAADVSVPDGASFNPGENFTKTWRLQNLGSCDWTSSFALVFSSGDQMSGSALQQLSGNVKPGSTIDLSVNLVAPKAYGTYQGNWMLRDAKGNLFGVGADGKKPIWVKMVTGSYSSDFAVKSVALSVNPSYYSGYCPVIIASYAQIWTNTAGTVTYYWQRSDGSKTSENTLTYSDAGVQTVTDAWALGSSVTTNSAWDQIYIDQPNHQVFGPVNFYISCKFIVPSPTMTPTETPTSTQPPTMTPTRTPTPTST